MMRKCLKCAAYEFLQFGRRAITQVKSRPAAEGEHDDDGKYNKKVKMIYGKDK